MRKFAFAVLLLAAVCNFAQGYPNYWFNPAFGYFSSDHACTSHPLSSYASLGSPHGKPVNDTSIAFAVTNAGAAAASLCPGTSYSLKISFPQSRLALLSATQATFTSPSPTVNCPNRVDLGNSRGSGVATSFTAIFTVPCNATGSVVFMATTAGKGSADQWAQATLSMAVNPACAAVACGGSAASPSPAPASTQQPSPSLSPSPSPASQTPSPSPSPSSTASPSPSPSPSPRSPTPSRSPSPSPSRSPSPARSPSRLTPPLRSPSPPRRPPRMPPMRGPVPPRPSPRRHHEEEEEEDDD